MLPRLRKDFKSIVNDRPLAILFLDFDGKTYWIPRSLCTLIKEKKDRVIVTISVMKWEEITNIKYEPLTTHFASIGDKVLPQHQVDCELIESKSYPLRPEQKVIVQKALKSKYNAFLCDAGTGKTLMSLTLAYSRQKAGLTQKIFVLCPASLIAQWKKLSIEYFHDINIEIHSIHGASYVDSMARIASKFKDINGSVELIVDESHLCRNQSAIRSRNIEKTFNTDYASILTGFPIERNAGDLFYQFGIMSRDIIGEPNFGAMQRKFFILGGKDAEEIVGYQNTAELSKRISPYIHRLKLSDVAPEIPEKHYHDIYFDLNNNQYLAYKAINSFMASYKYLPKNKQYQLGTFMQKISSGYTPTEDEINSIFADLGKIGEGTDNVNRIGTIQFDSANTRIQSLLNILNENESHQFIIWCNFIDEMEAINQKLKNSEIINGSTDLKERTKIISRFVDGKTKYLIISIAINEGLNLQCCNHEIFYSDNYSRTKGLNAEERIHRIGQDKTCHIYKLIARNSLDERIKAVRNRKQKICNIFDNENSNIEE